MFKCLNKIVLVVESPCKRLVGAHEMTWEELSFFGLVPPTSPPLPPSVELLQHLLLEMLGVLVTFRPVGFQLMVSLLPLISG